MTTATQKQVDLLDEIAPGAQMALTTNWRRLLGLNEMGVYYALLLLITALTILTTYFGQANYLRVQNLSNVIYQASLIAIMAVPMTVVLISAISICPWLLSLQLPLPC